MNGQVRVNLLPSEVGKKNAARRFQGLLGVIGLGVIVLLGIAYMWQSGRVNDAQARQQVEEAKVQVLRTEVQQLAEFRRLADQGEAVNTMIAMLLAGDASLAGVLQDLAAVMPSDASIGSLSISLSETGGSVTSSGISLLGHAPGLERLLIALDKVAAFDDVFFTSSVLDEAGVASFAFNFDLTSLILTHRYDRGLPEVMR